MQNADVPAETLIIDDDEPPSGRLAIDTLYPALPSGMDPIHLTRPVFILLKIPLSAAGSSPWCRRRNGG